MLNIQQCGELCLSSMGAAFPKCLVEPELIILLLISLTNLFLSLCISHISTLPLFSDLSPAIDKATDPVSIKRLFDQKG